MPIYEYECLACGHKWEALEDRDTRGWCTKCTSSRAVRKLISLPARPQFKGSGFYEIDYKNKR